MGGLAILMKLMTFRQIGIKQGFILKKVFKEGLKKVFKKCVRRNCSD